MQKPDNEEHNECCRTTVDNRTLKYVLNVLQQPSKARACGNGPRASSDRRPVDPPPVVQLKVFEITPEGESDVTMNYDSGFMLYASLEVARPIANGRMQSPPHPPVLTGVCVASAAYLERPKGPSGYFIFPDVSVRHEGWYRLKFDLFEAVKHAQDADHDRPFPSIVGSASGDNKQTHLHQDMANRMDVSSAPFQVFSAKKFPGLEQSTEVSKSLADQGCRVRIRRDIRQRKTKVTDDKPKAEHSSRATPDIHSIKEHTRTHSVDSQYQEMRTGSIDSHYARPVPSRQISIASMTQASPTTPAATQMPMGPPTQRPGWEVSPLTSSYSPAAGYEPRWSSLPQQSAPARTLPPMNLPPMSNVYDYGSRPQQYDVPQAKAVKRSHSPAEYNQNDSMKQGARPDTLQMQPYQPPKPGDYIEPADENDQEEYDELTQGDLLFKRAEQRYDLKQNPGTPSGMGRLLH